jgi:hypothetical protein
MMESTPATIILFYTSNHAFRAERLLKERAIACKLIPVPRDLSSDCGVCLRLEPSRQLEALEIMKASKVEIAGAHGAVSLT